MRVRYKKPFLKQLARLPAGPRREIEQFVFHTLPGCGSIHETGKIEKMQGHRGYYKARFGAYRLGLKADAGDDVEILVVLHRREIYRQFP
jgi:mRNA interferase RelE/StbE